MCFLERLRAAEGERTETEAALHSVQGLNAELSAATARLERRVILLTKEHEGLQKLLASYSIEEGDVQGSQGLIPWPIALHSLSFRWTWLTGNLTINCVRLR